MFLCGLKLSCWLWLAVGRGRTVKEIGGNLVSSNTFLTVALAYYTKKVMDYVNLFGGCGGIGHFQEAMGSNA